MKRFYILVCIILFFQAPLYGISHPSTSIQIYFFYAEDCQPCQVILRDYLPTLKKMFPSFEIKALDVDNPAHYEALAKLEKKFNRRGEELPVLIIGEHLLSGEAEVMEKLNPLILEYQTMRVIPLSPIEIPSMAEPSDKIFSVDIVYFYQKGCPKCTRANYLLKYLMKKYPHLQVREIDLNTHDGKRLNETLSNRLHLIPEKRLIAPSMFIGNDYLSPGEMTESKVEALIQKYQKGEVISPLRVERKEVKKAEDSIVKRFKSFRFLAIISAGLIDGINPCAFTTLIFFISYLTMVGRNRKEILWMGIGFSISVFITYLLIGLGILRFIQYLSFVPLFSKILYMVILVFTLIVGILSLYDYIQLKRGRTSETKLQLPESLKKRIHKIIREKSHSTQYFSAAIASGFIVSLMEFTCTGQVYLPTILFMTNIPAVRTLAFSYLVLYNLMFIIPLLIIFLIAYWGVTSERLALFIQKRAPTIKLITSLLFFTLAGMLIFNLI